MPRMNYRLAQAVIATFQTEDSRMLGERISKFSYRAWKGTYPWLDASGLAIYFLDRLHVLHMNDAIPPRVLLRLKKNAADNQEKTNRLFEEFLKINRDFKNAGISYANLKGFTLAPDAFSEAALRCQLDLDFLIANHDISRCEQIMRRHGYLLTGIGSNVREFKAGGEGMPCLRNLYKVKPQRCVEIHFADDRGWDCIHFQDDRLFRLSSRRWRDLELPILSDSDKFIAQAVHLFKHLKGEWTRAAWILEFVNFVKFNQENHTLWIEVQRHVSKSEEIALAVGVATLVSRENFAMPCLPEVLTWTISQLPRPVSLWIERYGKRIVLAKFPGTKLYLLLCRALSHAGRGELCEVSDKLFPLRRPAKITVTNRETRLSLRLRGALDEIGYFFFGCAFTWNRVAVT
ncbi:nucleotidyltransferase family protein [Tunturiibacter gelidoferens]|nr:nucleotidyltransferase family protein [Edaphobacter lichenicola]